MNTDADLDDRRRPRRTRRRAPLPRLVRRAGRGGRGRRPGGLRLRHGQPRRAAAAVRLRRSSSPRSTRCRPRCAAGRHEYLNEAEDYGYSPDICGYVKADVAMQLRGGAHPDGAHPEAGARRAHQRLQHLHQVGRDLGADVRHARSSPSTCPGAAPTERPGPAPTPRLRARPPLRRGPAARARSRCCEESPGGGSTSTGCARTWPATNDMVTAAGSACSS